MLSNPLFNMSGKYKIVFVAVIIIMAAACTENKHLNANQECMIGSTDHKADTLVGTIIGSAHGTESHIDCMGDYLVMTSDQSHSYITLISLQSDSIIASFGDKGHARNEFLGVPRVPYMSNGNDYTMYCQDDIKNSTKVINLPQSINKGTCVVDTEYVHSDICQGHTTFLYSQGKGISKCDLSYDDARDNIFYPPYFIVNNGQEKHRIDVFPKLIETDLSSLYFIAYADMLRIKPDGAKVVQVFYHIDMFGIIDTESGYYRSFCMPNSYGFDFFVQLKSLDEAYKKVCIYNVDVCVTDKYIILLRDARSAHDFEEGYEDSLGSEIMFFDWDANYINTIYVAEHLKDIAFSDKQNALYAITTNELLYRYILDDE